MKEGQQRRDGSPWEVLDELTLRTRYKRHPAYDMYRNTVEHRRTLHPLENPLRLTLSLIGVLVRAFLRDFAHWRQAFVTRLRFVGKDWS